METRLKCQRAKILPIRVRCPICLEFHELPWFTRNTRIADAFARWNFFIVLKPKNNLKFQRANATAIRLCCKWIHPTVGWRRDEQGTHKHAQGLWILCSVSRIRSKTCIVCSALRHQSYLTLPYVTSLQDSFCLGTFAHGFIKLLPRTLASSRGYSLATNKLLQSTPQSSWLNCTWKLKKKTVLISRPLSNVKYKMEKRWTCKES